jgi:hypothetical protein
MVVHEPSTRVSISLPCLTGMPDATAAGVNATVAGAQKSVMNIFLRIFSEPE